MLRRALGLALVVLALLWPATVHRAQENTANTQPFTALWSDGDRVLIGQGAALIYTQVTPNDLKAGRILPLENHEIRDLAASGQYTLALSDAGLTALDALGTLTGFVPGGGQRLTVDGARLYVAALGAGVRILELDTAGALRTLGTVQTAGPARDLVLGGGLLWVAESNAGVRVYEIQDGAAPRPRFAFGEFTPAAAVRLSTNGRLYIGHADRLSIIETGDAPRLLSSLTLPGTVSDLAIRGSRVYAALAGGTADAAAIDTAPDGTARITALVTDPDNPGALGSGVRLARRGDDLFVLTWRAGLWRVRFGRGDPLLINHWPAPERAAGQAERCAATPPTEPGPPDRGKADAHEIALTWKAACAERFEVWVNGKSVASLPAESAPTDTPHQSFGHTLPAHVGVLTWQVVSIDAQGHRAVSPLWRFEAQPEAWAGAPDVMPAIARLYSPPPLDLQQPEGVLFATVLALCAGAFIVGTAAWVLGALAGRRAADRL